MPLVNANIITMQPSDMAQRHKIKTQGVGIYPIIHLGGIAEGFVHGDFFEVVKGYSTRTRVIEFDTVGNANLFSPSGRVLVDQGDVMFCTFDANDERWDLDYHRARYNTSWKPRPLEVYTITVGGVGEFFTVGDASQHNYHYRISSTSQFEIRVPVDDTFNEGDDDWDTNDNNPLNPSYMPDGGSVLFTKTGPGDVVFVPGPGVVIRCPPLNQPRITQQWGKAVLTKVTYNEWDIEGNLALAE